MFHGDSKLNMIYSHHSFQSLQSSLFCILDLGAYTCIWNIEHQVYILHAFCTRYMCVHTFCLMMQPTHTCITHVIKSSPSSSSNILWAQTPYYKNTQERRPGSNAGNTELTIINVIVYAEIGHLSRHFSPPLTLGIQARTSVTAS